MNPALLSEHRLRKLFELNGDLIKDAAQFDAMAKPLFTNKPILEGIRDYLTGSGTGPWTLAILLYSAAGRDFLVDRIENHGLPVDLVYGAMMHDGLNMVEIGRPCMLYKHIETGGAKWEPDWLEILSRFNPDTSLAGLLEVLASRARRQGDIGKFIAAFPNEFFELIGTGACRALDPEIEAMPSGQFAMIQKQQAWRDLAFTLSSTYCSNEIALLKFVGADLSSETITGN